MASTHIPRQNASYNSDLTGSGPDYTYTAAGRLSTRLWARTLPGSSTRVTTTYGYTTGRLTGVTYNDGTPSLAYTYDSLGRQTTRTNGLATSAFTYDPSTLAIDAETITYNLPNQAAFTRIIDRSLDSLGRDSGWDLKNGATIENSVRYGYSPADGRISSISNPQLSNVSFAYGFEPQSNLIKTVTGPIHTVTSTWEADRNALGSRQNKVGTTTISSYTYGVNSLGQRTNVAQTGTAFGSVRDIIWGYNDKGEVTKADHTIPGLDRAYLFDAIGNRLKTADSLTLPASNNYTPNALNQYAALDTLNPVHDADGNMTSGPLPANVNANSTLAWDGENRLIQAQVTGGATVNFTYDSQSRRIAETVGIVTKLTIYDGWNPIAEYSISNNQYAISKSYTWGIDLSGSIQGAGGVGGLLAVTDSTGTYYPTFDGNGNVSEYLNSTGTVVAHYEYDPFGRTTVATGSKANDFSHRFSTKPLDSVTGLYYYTYRWYNTYTGGWPSRDPIEERGGVNLYGFVGNDGMNFYDILGLAVVFENTWSRPNDDLWEMQYETGQISVTIYANSDSCIECNIAWPNYETGEWEPTTSCSGWTKFTIGVGINITGSPEGIRESKSLLPNVTMRDPSNSAIRDEFHVYDEDSYALLGEHAYGESDIGELHCGGGSKDGQITLTVGNTGVQTINYSIKTEFCGKASATATILNLDVDGGNSKRGGGGIGPSLPLPLDAPGGINGTPPSPMRPLTDPYSTYPGDTRPLPF